MEIDFGVINADVNGARNILRKFKKNWFELVTGLKKVVRIRIYKLFEGISESLLFAGIGVEGGVNPPEGIRVGVNLSSSLRSSVRKGGVVHELSKDTLIFIRV